MRRSWLGIALVLPLSLGGCPAALDDRFVSVPGASEGVDAAAGSGGRSATVAGGTAAEPSGASNQGGTDVMAGTTAAGGNSPSGGGGGDGASGSDGASGAAGDGAGAGGGAGAPGSNELATLSDFCIKCSQCFDEPGFTEGFCAPFIGATSFDIAGCKANGNPANLTNPDETLTRLQAMTCTAFDTAQ